MLLFLEPQEVSFVDEDGVDKADYNDGEVGPNINFFLKKIQTLQVELDSINKTESIFCKATKVRPAPQFIWTFGKNEIQTCLLWTDFLPAEIDGVPVEITPENIPELENATIYSAEQSSWDGSAYQNQYLDVTQRLELPVIGWLDTKTLGCRIEIHDTNGINLTPPAAKLSRNVTFTVPGNT